METDEKSEEGTDKNLNENEDLEDGEIDDDDEDEPSLSITLITPTSNSTNENSLQIQSNKKEIENEKLKDKSSPCDSSAKSDLRAHEKFGGCSSKSNSTHINKKSKYKFDEDNAENSVTSSLKKEGSLPKAERENRVSLYISEDERGGGAGCSGVDGGGGEESGRNRNKGDKKRKRRENERKSKKKMKHHQEYNKDEIDDYEMLCIRGGSPPPVPVAHASNYYDSDNSYQSYESYDSQDYNNFLYQDRRQNRKAKDRRQKQINDKKGNGDKRKRDESDGICIPHMRGQCNDNDCPRSHESRAPLKLELCKFYLMERCAKKDKCSYMHSDFPCKYFYLGMECIYRERCKFSHGLPLTDQLRGVLLKHIETAPKDILGDFRRISRENALMLINSTHAKLCAERGIENTLALPTLTTQSVVTVNSNIQSPTRNADQNSTIPSLLDMVIRPPISSPHKDEKKGDKQRKSRWCDNDLLMLGAGSSIGMKASTMTLGQTSMMSLGKGTDTSDPGILSLKNLTGVISNEQIESLTAMGIKNLEQINQLTVAQLNSMGLTISQINEIQLNAMSIQKLGLIKSNVTATVTATATATATATSSSTSTSTSSMSSYHDVLTSSSLTTNEKQQQGTKLEFLNPSGLYTDMNQSRPKQDVDMRFLVGSLKTSEDNHDLSPKLSSFTPQMKLTTTGIASPDTVQQESTAELNGVSSTYDGYSNSIDYSQYLKDSNLDIEKADLNDIILDRDDCLNEDEPGLLIDESWESDDEEKDNSSKSEDNDITNNTENNKKKSESTISDYLNIFGINASGQMKLNLNKRDSELSVKGGNCNIDDDNNSIPTSSKMSGNQESVFSSTLSESMELRDPRLIKTNTLSQTHDLKNVSSSIFGIDYTSTIPNYKGLTLNTYASNIGNSNMDREKNNSDQDERKLNYGRISIYDGFSKDCDNSTLTQKKFDQDMRMSPFIVSSNNDIDLRLPFKPVMNYTPASEIDGSVSSHPPIIFKLFEVEIPKPDYNDVKKNVSENEKIQDPRLRRIFCLKESISNLSEKSPPQNEESYSPGSNSSSTNLYQKCEEANEKPACILSGGPRADPRRRKETQDVALTASGSNNTDKLEDIDIKMILQKSDWYTNLNSNHKIMVNQQLALVSTELKKFHQDSSPNKVFDMSFIATNQCLQQILTSLCIYIDSNGHLRQLESEDDGDGSSSMRLMGMMGGVMDPNIGNVSQLASGSGGMILPSNGPSQLAAMLPAGMFLRGVNSLNMGQNISSAGTLMSQFRPQSVRPGLLGIAPGIYNPFDLNTATGSGNNNLSLNEKNDGRNDQKNFNPFRGGTSAYDQGNFYGRHGDSDVSGDMMGRQGKNRRMRNNFRQGGGNRKNSRERWNMNGGNNRDGKNVRRHFDNKGRDGRRDKSHKS